MSASSSAAVPFDWISTITDEAELTALASFKSAIDAAALNESEKALAVAMHDGDLMRFLRARELHVDKALHLLVECVQWRVQHKPWELKHSTEPGLQACRDLGVMFICDEPDTLGRPVVVMRIMFNPNPIDSRINHLVDVLEKAVERLAPPVTQFVFVASFKHFARSPGGREVAQASLNILQTQYAERLGAFFLVNTPWLFSALYTLMSPFISARTRAKLHWVSGDEAPIRQALAPVIPDPHELIFK